MGLVNPKPQTVSGVVVEGVCHFPTPAPRDVDMAFDDGSSNDESWVAGERVKLACIEYRVKQECFCKVNTALVHPKRVGCLLASLFSRRAMRIVLALVVGIGVFRWQESDHGWMTISKSCSLVRSLAIFSKPYQSCGVLLLRLCGNRSRLGVWGAWLLGFGLCGTRVFLGFCKGAKARTFFILCYSGQRPARFSISMAAELSKP